MGIQFVNRCLYSSKLRIVIVMKSRTSFVSGFGFPSFFFPPSWGRVPFFGASRSYLASFSWRLLISSSLFIIWASWGALASCLLFLREMLGLLPLLLSSDMWLLGLKPLVSISRYVVLLDSVSPEGGPSGLLLLLPFVSGDALSVMYTRFDLVVGEIFLTVFLCVVVMRISLAVALVTAVVSVVSVISVIPAGSVFL